jgi:hypothetical protein
MKPRPMPWLVMVLVLGAVLAEPGLVVPGARASLFDAVRDAVIRTRKALPRHIRQRSALTPAQRDSIQRLRLAQAAKAQPIAAPAELKSSVLTRKGLELAWSVPDTVKRELRVHRRDIGGSWRYLGRVTADRVGRAAWRDSTLRPGQSVEYGLEVRISRGSRIVSFPRVDIPGGSAPRIRARLGADGGAVLMIELPSDLPATLEVFDVSGRSLGSLDISGLRAGRHEVVVPREFLPTNGIYFARLGQDGIWGHAKAVVAR